MQSKIWLSWLEVPKEEQPRLWSQCWSKAPIVVDKYRGPLSLWKAGTQKTRSIEGYFLGGASVTLGSLYVPETQICQLEARNGPCFEIETMFCGQSLEWSIPFSPCFLLGTGPEKLIKVQLLTAAIGMAQDSQGHLEQEFCLARQQQSTNLKWTFFPCNIPLQVPFLCLLIVTKWFSTPRMKFFCLYNHLFLLIVFRFWGQTFLKRGLLFYNFIFIFLLCLSTICDTVIS